MSKENLDLLLLIIDKAMNGENSSELFTKLMPHIEPQYPLKLSKIIEICSSKNCNFIVEIGYYGEECQSLTEYMEKNNIKDTTYFSDFFNKLGNKEIIFTNSDNTKSIIYKNKLL